MPPKPKITEKMILLIGIIIQSAAMIICWIATDQNRFKADYQG